MFRDFPLIQFIRFQNFSKLSNIFEFQMAMSLQLPVQKDPGRLTGKALGASMHAWFDLLNQHAL